jgi:hypothetical protein
VVNDGRLDSESDSLTVTTGNTRPVADAGPDQTATVGETVFLDGTASYDADGDALSFLWSLLSRPDGSFAAVSDADKDIATLVPDGAGLYVAQLIVSDGELPSDPDTATVEILVGNQPPEFTSSPPGSAILGAAYGYHAQAKDPEGGTVTFELIEGPAGMIIDPDTGVIAWTPGPADLGDHPVTVQAMDPLGATAIQGFTITVYPDCTTVPAGLPACRVPAPSPGCPRIAPCPGRSSPSRVTASIPYQVTTPSRLVVSRPASPPSAPTVLPSACPSPAPTVP